MVHVLDPHLTIHQLNMGVHIVVVLELGARNLWCHPSRISLEIGFQLYL